MWYAIKRVAPGLLAIALTATILLVADRPGRPGGRSAAPQVAILKFVSHATLDTVEQGIRAGLQQRGFVPDRTIRLRLFNAQADLPTASSMASAIVDGDYALVVTISTPCLQAMANANKTRQLPQLFGAVTDPFGAGVGITPTTHPPYLTGIGSFDPVAEAFDLAKRLCPALRRVGVVWNLAEAASRACMDKARPECRKLGLELVEANIENTSGVKEAAASVVERGAEAIWITNDNTASAGTTTILAVARDAGIPVFSNDVAKVPAGALFAVGADYYQVGLAVGELAGKILAGLKPADVPVKDVLPRQIGVNLSALHSLKAKWTVDRRTRDEAAILLDERGTQVRAPAGSGTPPGPGDGKSASARGGSQ